MRIPLLTALALGAATPAFAVEPACVAAVHRMFEFLAQEAKGTRMRHRSLHSSPKKARTPWWPNLQRLSRMISARLS